MLHVPQNRTLKEINLFQKRDCAISVWQRDILPASARKAVSVLLQDAVDNIIPCFIQLNLTKAN
jgi:hypothetical protein